MTISYTGVYMGIFVAVSHFFPTANDTQNSKLWDQDSYIPSLLGAKCLVHRDIALTLNTKS